MKNLTSEPIIYQTIQVVPVSVIMPEIEGLRRELADLKNTNKPMTSAEFADYLQIGRSPVHKLIQQGLPHVRVCSDPRFYREDVD